MAAGRAAAVVSCPITYSPSISRFGDFPIVGLRAPVIIFTITPGRAAERPIT